MSATGASSPVASPCIDLCRLDAAGRICLGCRRTLGEIAEWSRASEARRRAILSRIEATSGTIHAA